MKLSQFSEVVELVTNTLLPHHLCSYLYELAQEFNRFYENNKVIGDENESTKLAFVKLYRIILKRGLEILGIPTPERM